ncbi:SCP-like protein [Ancylostoma caninum]|uniref:SCP-like protein n=1 Tax=Ancylostoma caninum TaxID=29170 RepID=A0A368G7W1_ANCCA|nr:SCP-like protein [Ancylostoma caninum]
MGFIAVLLFFIAIAEDVTAQFTICPSPTISDDFRNMALDMHNNFRSSIALGQYEVNGKLGIAPPASLMYPMEYDCTAESYALSHVRKCDRQLSPQQARPGYKENINVFFTTGTNGELAAVEHAINKWWGQLRTHGFPTNMIFTEAVRRRTTNVVTKFAKMAWWSNTQLGCATHRCNGFYFTSCMYGPGGGNIVGQAVYQIGAVCSGCSGTCDAAVGLCM